jgi:hypothetical protein
MRNLMGHSLGVRVADHPALHVGGAVQAVAAALYDVALCWTLVTTAIRRSHWRPIEASIPLPRPAQGSPA